MTNLAARLCQQAKAGEILLSQRVYAEVGDAIAVDDLGELQLLGFARPAPARLRKTAESIAAFARNAKRKSDNALARAVSAWEADLAYLKKTFDDGRYDFPWPKSTLVAS